MAEQQYFFCGVAGSGMLPLASYLQAQGARVSGSDRSFDQGRLPEKKAQIEELGIVLHPQDGSGLTGPDQILVTSAAVEATIPDVAAAERVGVRRMTRAEVLSGLANAAPISVGIAGTSGKSTTTAMLAHILIETGRDPAIINGAGMLNVRGNDGAPLGWRAGKGPFLCEVDESDGSIDLYRPSIGVILNISEDHKSMAELEAHFSAYQQRSGSSVLGVASPPVAQLAASAASGPTRTFAAYDPDTNDRPEVDFYAADLQTSHTGVSALVTHGAAAVPLSLQTVGSFNISNALAALATAVELGVSLEEGCLALKSFAGTARRLQQIGRARGVTVIDDFAHNPDKIASSIGSLTDQYKRIWLLYQPHGYGPLRQFRSLYEQAFNQGLRRGIDHLFLTKPAYFGGTVTKTDDAKVMADALAAHHHHCQYLDDRNDIAEHITDAQEGDAVIIMGARDDTLTDLARHVLATLGSA